MNIKVLSASALFLAAAFSVNAQVTVAANDIVVGFRNTGSGVANNLEVKAGSVSALAAFSTETLIGNYNSLLTGQSATWASSGSGGTAEFWAGVGASNASLVFATKKWDNTVAGTLGIANSTGWNIADTGTPNTNINTMYTSFNGLAAIQNNDGTSIQIAKSNSGSWNTLTATNGFGIGGYNGTMAEAANQVANGPQPYSAEDLYSVTTSGSTFLGTFALYGADGLGHSKGDLTFTAAAAIPEPSTYAAILGAAVLAFVMLRRRNQVALV